MKKYTFNVYMLSFEITKDNIEHCVKDTNKTFSVYTNMTSVEYPIIVECENKPKDFPAEGLFWEEYNSERSF